MSAGHFTYLSPFISDQNWQKFLFAVAVGAVVVAAGKIASSHIGANAENKVVPDEKFSLFGFFDVFVEGFVKFQDSILGKENRKYLPLTASAYLFIFTLNLIGLIPGMPAATTTVWLNVGMALVVFCSFNWYGIREHGFFSYIKHFAGPVWWMAVLIFPLEIFSTCLRIVTLNLRLFWNITADHLVLDAFFNIAPVIPIVFYALGTFVCFMQAFVFTLLTMIYILLATQHEEEHH